VAGDWVEPTAVYGLAFGYGFARDHSVDLEVGKSRLGHFLATRYRADFEIENARNLFMNLAIGPQLALKNKLLGLKEPAPSTETRSDGTMSFHHLALSTELAAGVFVWQGFYLRTSATLLFKVATNLDTLCQDARFRADRSCPEVGLSARDAVTGFIRLGGGYAW
jgi:hypothetical protein